MITLRRAVRRRLRGGSSTALLTALAVLAAASPALAQERQPPSVSSHEASPPPSDSGRSAVATDHGASSSAGGPAAYQPPAYQPPAATTPPSDEGRHAVSTRGGDAPDTRTVPAVLNRETPDADAAEAASRSAHPSGGGHSGGGGGPSRQPPTHSGGHSGGGGGHSSGGSHSGGHSGHSGRGGHVFISPGGFYDPFYFWGPYPHYGWWGGAYWGDPYVYGPGGYYYRGDGQYSDKGALDLDVWPGDTEVWLDGERIGTVDDFDGWPQYLWLEKGTYDLVLFRQGYKTVAKQMTIYPGLVIDVNDRLEAGESTPPDKMMTPQSSERRDARLRAERERQEAAQGQAQGDDDWSSWRDRIRRRRDDRDGRDGRYEDRRRSDSDTGLLVLKVEPDDASIYVDGRFAGSAEQLEEDGLELPPGPHKVSVVRPGRTPKDQSVEIEAGRKVELSVKLDVQ
jgi:hypothetical protein